MGCIILCIGCVLCCVCRCAVEETSYNCILYRALDNVAAVCCAVCAVEETSYGAHNIEHFVQSTWLCFVHLDALYLLLLCAVLSVQ